MKNSVVAIFLLALFFSLSVHASCVKDRYGKKMCGKGQCATDQYGQNFCANAGGGAMSYYGKVVCGAGLCAKDDNQKVWCSRTPDGGAAMNDHGKVECFGGCVTASAKKCQEAP